MQYSRYYIKYNEVQQKLKPMKNSKLVYSTDQGRVKTTETSTPNKPRGDGIVRLRRETKGRKGAGVVLIDGLELPEAELKALAKKLKQLCGTGGSIKNGIIEIQGDQRQKLAEHLEKEGFKVKLAGG